MIQSEQATARVATDDEATAVRRVIEAYADRMRADDVASIVDLFTEHAAVMAPDLDVAVGRAALTDVYRAALDAVAMDFTFTFDDVAVWGDTATVRSHTVGTNTVRATGDLVPGRYRELFVLRRGTDAWKIARYMFQPVPERS